MYEDELTCGGGVGLLPVLPGQPEPEVRATQDVGRGAPHPGGEHSVFPHSRSSFEHIFKCS